MARGPDSTLIRLDPAASRRSRSASASVRPNASMNRVSVARLSILPDNARSTVSLSCRGSTSLSPCVRGWRQRYLASTSATARWLT